MSRMTMETTATARQAKRQGRALATNPRFAWLARLGYVARGVVYIIVGGLAAFAAVGRGGQTTGSRGALQTLTNQPWGQALLAALGVGLLAFAIWRAVQAVADTDNHGSDAKGAAVRAGFGVSAVTHGLLAIYAVGIAFGRDGGGQGGGDGGAQSWSAWVLNKPAGQWLLGLVGLIIAGVGVSQIVKGWKEKYRKRLAVDWQKMKWANPVCKLGLIARGVVFVLIGVFVVVAAYRADPGQARGFGGALQSLQGQPYGAILLLVVALGLIAFGVYSIIEAVYRRIGQPA